MCECFLTEHIPGPRDTKGRFKQKVSSTLKHAETRKKRQTQKKAQPET